MADFDPPFGNDGERRLPTTTERELGFVCGPADRKLFTGMFNRIEAEIGEVITHAGIEQTDTRNTQLREAIVALIAAATGGGETEDFLLMSQARARLPIFPEIINQNAVIEVTAPSVGTIRLPAGVTFQHRGIYRETTVETDFPTAASKTYHLRWNPTDGFTLNDLASLVYNPTAAAESNIAFDSSYDDMLIARIVTNSSNVATISNLVNKNTLKYTFARTFLVYPVETLVVPETISYNFARTPLFFLNEFDEHGINSPPPNSNDGSETNFKTDSVTRYSGIITAWSFNAVNIRSGRPRYTGTFLAHGG